MNDQPQRGPLVPVILSGGAGTRLWPVSRRAHPKPRTHHQQALLGRCPQLDGEIGGVVELAITLRGAERIHVLDLTAP